MKRPLLIVAISYMIGIIIGVYLKISIPFVLLILSITCIIINRKYLKMIIIIIVTLAVSSTATIYINNRYENINKNLDGKNIKIIGTVCSQIEETDYKYIVTIKTEKTYGNVKMLVYLKKDNAKLEQLEYGNKIMIVGTYNEPTVKRNYKGFDYKQYLKTKGICGIVETESGIKVIKTRNLNVIKLLINKISVRIKQNLNKILSEKTRGLAIGMLLGDSSNIESELKEEFRDCNLSHMLAVSGTHFSYLMICINLILNRKMLGIRRCKIISIIFIIIFMMITNMSPSVVRAGITTIIAILGSLIHRKQDTYTCIAISLLYTLIKNPFTLFNIGLQMSYLATLSIITIYPMMRKIKGNKIKKYIFESVLITVSANILILPISIYNFNTIPTNFLLSNLIAGPVLGISLISGLITIFVSFISVNLAKIPGILVNICFTAIIKITEIISKIQNITVVTPNFVSVIMIYFSIFIVILRIKNKSIFKKNIFKRVTVTLIIAFLVINLINTEKGMRLYFVDVGQGDSSLICTPTGKNILIDGGGNQNPDKYDVGEKVLLPYLLDRRIRKIDYIIISHFDADHAQGLEAVIKKIKVKNIIVGKQASESYEYEKIVQLCREKKINIMKTKRGEKIVIDKYVYFDVLHPGNVLLDDGKGGLNANALVMKLYYKHGNNTSTVLFTGDIEDESEQELVKIYGKKLKSDILKVAHHGSKTSSSQEFIKLVNPEIALIGVGEDNKFGHPNESVLERLRDLKCKIYRTDENGEISVKVKSEGRLKLECCVK